MNQVPPPVLEPQPVESARGPRPRMIRVLPSVLTLGNLLCGFASIFYASRNPDTLGFHQSQLPIAAMLIFLGMIFDALDGRMARLTGQTSELGEQLDSMADMVTFGAAPAFLVIQMVGLVGDVGTPFFGSAKADTLFGRAVFVVSGAYVACCALRLARFNIEIDQPEEADHLSFKGLPSPAAAGTVASLVLLHESLLADFPDVARVTAIGLVLISLLAAVAMVSRLRYTHLLNRYLRDRAPFEYLATAVLVLVPLLLKPKIAIAAGFVLYSIFPALRLIPKALRGRSSGRDEPPAS
ncbi:MAG: phosphatidylcholine/phosphatidylserine synthase [Phycisphaerae bacterium]|nr:phosphatidylcholine/phosphatidylserine synthase [Phycisphaerae bacterium]